MSAPTACTSAVASRTTSDLCRTLTTSPTPSRLCPDSVLVLEHYKKLLRSCLQLRTFLCLRNCVVLSMIFSHILFVLRNCDIGLLRVAFAGVVKIHLIPFLVVLSFFPHARTCSPPVSSYSTHISNTAEVAHTFHPRTL